MSDEAIVRLLEELRDLAREAGQRQERALVIIVPYRWNVAVSLVYR